MNHEARSPISRAVRLERKWRGCFRCEWCNRWTQVPMEDYWKRLHMNLKGKRSPEAIANNKKNARFFCHRSGCVESRTM